MKLSPSTRAFTLVEMLITTVLIGVLGFIIYSLLTTNMILGAKNTAINVAHQQSRSAMLRMMEGIHASASLPVVSGLSGNGTASVVSFQQFVSGPHKILQNATADTNPGVINIALSPGYNGTTQPPPVVGQRLIIPNPQIEDTITAVSGSSSNLTVTLTNPLPASVDTASPKGDVICYVTNPCSYTLTNTDAQITQNGVTGTIANGITSAYSGFSIPALTPGSNFVNFNLAASDAKTSNYNSRRFSQSRDVSLTAQVPIKYRLTAFAGAGNVAPSPTP